MTPQTCFGGTCPGCGRWCTYRPLPGGSTPGLPVMNVTCRGCGGKVVLEADAGQTHRQPLVIERAELDLSQLRRHVREQHSRPAYGSIPRSNTDLAVWHGGQHHRHQPGHVHFGPYVLIRNSRGHTTGQIPRPSGWFTGQDAKTRAELAAEWRERRPRPEPEPWLCVDCGYPYPLPGGPSPEAECDNCGGEFGAGGKLT